TAGPQTITLRDSSAGVFRGEGAVNLSPARGREMGPHAPPSGPPGAALPPPPTPPDALRHLPPGHPRTGAPASSGPFALLPAPSTFTAADQGRHSFLVTLRSAGSASLSAHDMAAPIGGALANGLVVLNVPRNCPPGATGWWTWGIHSSGWAR